MDKGKIRVALAALSVAGLLAGVTMSGCRTSCTGGSHMDNGMQHDGGSSCTGSTKSKPEMKEKM